MGAYRTTKKAVHENYGTVICCGYCNIQTLLSDVSRVAYLTRVEGWAADVFDLGGGVAVVTGYAPFGNIRPAYDLQRKYEDAARRVCNTYDFSQIEKRTDALAGLRAAFVAECVLWDVFSKKQTEIIKDNLNAFINNFGVPRVVPADFGGGFYVFSPGETSDSWVQFCYDISYFNGWLYGAVQAENKCIKKGVRCDC